MDNICLEFCDSEYIKDFEIIVFDHDMLLREIQINQKIKTFHVENSRKQFILLMIHQFSRISY